MAARFKKRKKTVYEIVDTRPEDDDLEMPEGEERIIGVYDDEDVADLALGEYNAE